MSSQICCRWRVAIKPQPNWRSAHVLSVSHALSLGGMGGKTNVHKKRSQLTAKSISIPNSAINVATYWTYCTCRKNDDMCYQLKTVSVYTGKHHRVKYECVDMRIMTFVIFFIRLPSTAFIIKTHFTNNISADFGHNLHAFQCISPSLPISIIHASEFQWGREDVLSW